MNKMDIVIATYNGAKYIEDQLYSIITSINFNKIINEIIISNFLLVSVSMSLIGNMK